MPRKKEITVTRSFGTVSKAEIFEELIWKVCGARVKLKPAPVGGGRDSFRTASEDGNRIRR